MGTAQATTTLLSWELLPPLRPGSCSLAAITIAFNHTFNGQYASGTPYFIGNEPAMFNVAGTLYHPMQGPRDAAYALTRSVYGNSSALLSGTFDDVLMGSSAELDLAIPQTYPTTGRGIPYTSLTAAQQAQVKAMIEAWVNDMDSTTASSLLSVYEDADALANTYVGYSGTGTMTQQGDYIRVDGPRVWIEFCSTERSRFQLRVTTSTRSGETRRQTMAATS